jgi:tetratricopeptide (TPR) repeat protein
MHKNTGGVLMKNCIYRLFIIFALIYFVKFAISAETDNAVISNLENKYSSADDFAIKKHLKAAIDLYQKGEVKSYKEEIEVLKQINKTNIDFYESVLSDNIQKPQQSVLAKDGITETAGNQIISPTDKKNKDVIMEKMAKAHECYIKSDTAGAISLIHDVQSIAKNYSEAKALLSMIESEVFIKQESRPFQDIIKQYFDDAMVLYRRALYKEAEEKFSKAGELDPSNEQVKKFLEITREKRNGAATAETASALLESGEKIQSEGEIAKARKLYEKVLAADPGNPGAKFHIEQLDKISVEYVDSARALYEGGKIEGSFENLKKALLYNPENQDAIDLEKKVSVEVAGLKFDRKKMKLANSFYNKGVNAYAKGEYEKATGFWEKTLAINPEDSEAAANIEKARSKMGETQAGGAKTADEAIKEADDLFDQGVLDKAQAKYEYVLRLEPGNKKAGAKIEEIQRLQKGQSSGGITKR